VKKSPRLQVPTSVMLRIAARDQWKCHVCEQGYLPADPWEIDHDKPLAKGGTNHVNNLRLAHKRCNREKSDA
jgi:5-methylcytosine-specific restriction endonuclease McrA